MNKPQENKKCFCARCFLPIESDDRVDIDGQNFHRICSTCCICRIIPTSLKMFYGHVFCNDCFKTHVLTNLNGDSPRLYSNSWWMQWGPAANAQDKKKTDSDKEPEGELEDQRKRFICARCLQPVIESQRVKIGDQNFHAQCGQCCFCHKVPSTNVKIYYGHVFCEACFQRYVLNRNKDNPSEFFKTCFEQWQNSAQFADNMRSFMGGNRESAPFIFMMQGQQPPFCRCGFGPQDCFQTNETRTNDTRKSAILAMVSFDEDTQSWDLSVENRDDVSIPDSNEESAKEQNFTVAAAEKIEKLTKYLHEESEFSHNENWKYLENNTSIKETFYNWIDLHDKRITRGCPKCLWQCGPIYVNSEYTYKTKCFMELK